MSSNAKSFLNRLKDINDANTVTVKLPSSGKDVEFKLVSVMQQKAMLRTAFDGVDGVILRAVAANNIITENALGDNEVLIIDKPAIFTALRKKSLGSKIKIKDVEYDLDDATPVNVKDVKLKHVIEYEDIKIDLKIPTISIDSKVATKLAKEFGKLEAVEDKLKQSLDIVISHESAKYVDKVTLGKDSITFDDISVHERVDIVNNLPLAINNKIVNYISKVKQVTDKALTVAEEVVVEIDASFLSAD